MAGQTAAERIRSCISSGACLVLLAAEQAPAEKAEPLLKRLDPVSRAKIAMGLTGLVLLGALLIAIVVLWARSARRKSRERFPATRAHDDEWYNKPLVPKPSDEQGDESD